MITTVETEDVDFSRVKRAEYNPRVELKPGDREFENLKKSLAEFGIVQDLVWNRRTGNLVGGHQRMTVLEHEKHTSARMKVVDLDPEAEKRLNVILNALSGRWDETKLAPLLRDLNTQKLDINSLGFTPVQLDQILGAKPKPTRANPDDPANVPTIPITRPGDLYELTAGARTHRLLCGDTRIHSNLEIATGGRRAQCVFIDPPYGVAYDNSARGEGRRPLGTITNDELKDQALIAFLVALFRTLHTHSVDRMAFYAFCADVARVETELAMQEAGFHFKQEIVWVKHFALTQAHYHWAHEPLLYGCKQGHNAEWFGPRTQTTVWPEGEIQDFKKKSKDELVRILTDLQAEAAVWRESRDPSKQYVHPTQKPTNLAARAIRNSTMPGDLVLDGCAGSGSTMIAAELHDRAAAGLDDDPRYVDAAVKRFLTTFENAKALRNGQPFTI